MKKVLSSVLCLVMVLSCFFCLSLTASAVESPSDYLKVTNTSCIDDKITFTVSVNAGKTILGTVVFFEYDAAMLKPVAGGGLPAAGSALVAGGKLEGNDNVYSTSVLGNKAIGGSSDTGILSLTFQVIGSERKDTAVKVRCNEMLVSKNNHLDYSASPALIKSFNCKTVSTVKNLTVAVSNDSNYVAVKWIAVPNVNSYSLYRSDNYGEFVLYTNVIKTATAYNDVQVEDGHNYRYYMVANIGNYSSSLSDITIAKVDYTSSVATPTGVTALNGACSMGVKWNAVSGAQKYYVYKLVGGTWKYIGNSTTTSFIDPERLVAGNSYSYRVRAIKGGICSGVSASSTAVFTNTIASVSGVRALSQGITGISVTWNPVFGSDVYEVYRAEIDKYGAVLKPYKSVAIIRDGRTAIIDRTLKHGTIYKYVVIAGKNGVCSKFNATSSVAWYSGVYAPKNVTVKSGAGSFILNWNGVADASKYYVYRRLAGSNDAWLLVAKPAKTTLTDTVKMDNGKAYEYQICAIINNNECILSKVVTTPAYSNKSIPNVSGVKASAATTGVTVSWTAPSGISKFRVYRAELDKNGRAVGGYVNLGNTTSKTFVDKNAVAGKTYRYSVYCMVGENLGATGIGVKVLAK